MMGNETTKDKEFSSLCKRLALRFAPQAKHLGARKDVLDELFNVAYVAGKEGKNIIWELVDYTTKPTSSMDDTRRRAFRTYDRRMLYQEKEKSPEEITEEKDTERRILELLMELGIDDLVLLVFYFGRGESYKDIGKIYHQSGWWISKRIRGILKKLRKEMEE